MTKNIQEEPKNSGAANKAESKIQPKQKGRQEVQEEEMAKESLGNDYWDRIADDVASGYEGKNDKDDILNTDQEADDHIRGDAAS